MRKKITTDRDVKSFTTGMIIGGAVKILSGLMFGPVATIGQIVSTAVSYGAWSVVLDHLLGKIFDFVAPKIEEMEAEMKMYNVA